MNTPEKVLSRMLKKHIETQGSVLSERHALSIAKASGSLLKSVYIEALEQCCVPRRYIRNMGVFGPQGQIRLLRSRILLAGCGGLGSWIGELCARAGAGTLYLMDGDVFEESNLNRQLYCTPESLGKSKAREAARRIRTVNPGTLCVPFSHNLQRENALLHLEKMDAAVDALDNNSSRKILFEAAGKARVPVIHGAVGGLWGQCGIIFPQDPTLLEMFPGPDTEYEQKGTPGEAPEEQKGNLSCTVASIAALQAALLFKLLSGKGELHKKRYWWLDLDREIVEFIKI